MRVNNVRLEDFTFSSFHPYVHNFFHQKLVNTCFSLDNLHLGWICSISHSRWWPIIIMSYVKTSVIRLPLWYHQNSSYPSAINTYVIFLRLQAEYLLFLWFCTTTNSTSSPGCISTPSWTSVMWKNNFLPSSFS